jgi:predicted RND superfamily exporter protein
VSRLASYTALVERRARLVLALAAGLVALAALLASRLELRTNVAELLPSKDPAVIELERLARSLDGTAILQLAIESPDRDANLRFARVLADKLRALPRDTVSTVAYDVKAERQFFTDRRWLYVALPDLEALRDALDAEIAKKTNPLYVDLEDHEPPEKLLERLKKKSSKLDQFPTGYFEGDGGRLVVIVCRPPGGLFAERAGEKLADAARRLVATEDPHRFHPQMTVGLTGDVIAQLEERAALENDLVWATGMCVTLVCLVVVLFYGRFRALVFVGVPAVAGVAVAFACAELAFGYLNASTAFLGSIVLGNGINFPIIQLARYDEERRAGRPVAEAVAQAIRGTLRATGIAATGAALAYGSLVVTRFRGFQQFGVIGGVGMLAAWLATVTVLPALLFTFDRAGGRRRFALPTGRFGEALARLSTRAPRWWLLAFAVLTVVSVLPLKRYLGDPFEYDFRNLRNRRSLQDGGAALAPRVDRVFGLTLTPSVVLADRRAHTDEIRRIVLERDRTLPGGPLLGDVTTLDDFLPGDAATQAKKRTVLAELRKLVDGPEMKKLDDDQRKRAAELRPPELLPAVTDDDLPAQVKKPFTELDGTLGRIVLVYHDRNVSVWDGHNLLRIAELIGEIPLSDGTVVRSSGHAVVFAAMIRSIVHDAPRATLASLVGVALLVLVLAGPRGAAPVLGVLLAGVLWMLGLGAWIGVKANFLNFIALPITFGIGVDYGINIWLRARAEGDPSRGVSRAGGAVALCSLTTIIGYGALLVADNQALRSFGEMAILGELACLSAALIGLPAMLALTQRGRVQASPAGRAAS